MADESRIDDLRGRIRRDPASIAFAQLAEELRRMGQFAEAADVCRAGLTNFPDYVSARITLGRALIGLNKLNDARRELEQARSEAPDNLTVVRALTELEDKQKAAAHPPAAALNYLESGKSAPTRGPMEGAEYVRVVRTLTALEAWLTAINVTRAE